MLMVFELNLILSEVSLMSHIPKFSLTRCSKAGKTSCIFGSYSGMWISSAVECSKSGTGIQEEFDKCKIIKFENYYINSRARERASAASSFPFKFPFPLCFKSFQFPELDAYRSAKFNNYTKKFCHVFETPCWSFQRKHSYLKKMPLFFK